MKTALTSVEHLAVRTPFCCSPKCWEYTFWARYHGGPCVETLRICSPHTRDPIAVVATVDRTDQRPTLDPTRLLITNGAQKTAVYCRFARTSKYHAVQRDLIAVFSVNVINRP
uniref:Uncharacterized protein n=1 Tax=Schistocephalus solidus TaxID=70667 RepID=A0A0X3Q0K7_SCHSO